MKYYSLYTLLFLCLWACTKTETVAPQLKVGDADFTYTLLSNGEVQFEINNTTATFYEWDFGNGETSTLKNPKENFVYNDTYTVTLIATDNNTLAKKTISKTVMVTNGKTPVSITDEWNNSKGTSGGANNSYRNHLYTFEVTQDNQMVIAQLQSADIDVAFYWYNDLGQNLDNYDNYNQPNFSRQFTNTKKLNKGKYSILILSKDRYAIGKYKLTIKGIDLAPLRVANNRLLKSGSFVDGGGGWDNYYSSNTFSPRNKQFSFDVTEDNSIVDINLASISADTKIFLYNNLGQKLDYSFNESRQSYLLKSLNKGNYTLYICAWRGVKTDFTIEIVGKVSNLTEKIFKAINLEDKFSGNSLGSFTDDRSYNDYTFDVTEDNTWVDITSESTGVKNYQIVTDNNGGDIVRGYLLTSDFYTSEVFKITQKGTYILSVRADSKNTNKLNLSVVGQIVNLKKLN